MSFVTAAPYPTINYSIDTIKDEARQLLERGIISPQQPIYVMCRYIPAREWVVIESELERSDYLLRDPIGDLVTYEYWEND